VLDSQRALVLRQDALAESQGKIAMNLVAAYKAVGGGWRMRCTPESQFQIALNTSVSTKGEVPGAPERLPLPPASDESTLAPEDRDEPKASNKVPSDSASSPGNFPKAKKKQ